MTKITMSLIILFILLFTKGLLLDLGFTITIYKLLFDGMLILVFFQTFAGKNRLCLGGISVLAYCFVSICSSTVFSGTFVPGFLFARYIVFSFLLLFSVWNCSFSAKDIRKINRWLIFLFLLQIIGSLFEIFVLHQKREPYISFMERGPGSAAAIFPLFTAMFLLGLFFYYKNKLKYLILIIAFCIIGYASSKRAIFFIVPVGVLTGWLYYAIRERKLYIKKIIKFSLWGCLAVFIFISVIKNVGRISEVSGSNIGEYITSLTNIGMKYSSGINPVSGATIGRTSTSNLVLANLFNRPYENILLGYGPSSVIGQGGDFENDIFSIDYGMTGWTQVVLGIGLLGLFFILMFYGIFYKNIFMIKIGGDWHPSWVAIHFGVMGSLLAFIFSFFFYSTFFTDSGLFNYVIMYLGAILLSPRHSELLKEPAF